jgi:hypothetical protein
LPFSNLPVAVFGAMNRRRIVERNAFIQCQHYFANGYGPSDAGHSSTKRLKCHVRDSHSPRNQIHWWNSWVLSMFYPLRHRALIVGELLEMLPLYEATQLKANQDKEQTEKKQTSSWFSKLNSYWSQN